MEGTTPVPFALWLLTLRTVSEVAYGFRHCAAGQAIRNATSIYTTYYELTIPDTFVFG